jgi:pimeloyl-ACP methyl ester carboxylesterase
VAKRRSEGNPRRRSILFDRLIGNAVNALILRPWLDEAALRLLTRWYFPLSRAWAAALTAGGDPARFADVIPTGRLTQRFVPRALETVEMRLAALQRAEQRWESAFFGDGPADGNLEKARLRAAAALMQSRTAFAPMHIEQPLPAIAFAIESVEGVTQRHGQRLLARNTAFQAQRAAEPIEASRGYLTRRGVEGWVRFPSPTAAGAPLAYARVVTPRASAVPMPSMVFAHGIGMEPEFWGEPRDLCPGLISSGVRMIRPEAPWHGRRRLAGTYGGEPVLARGPGGLLDFLHTHVIELGQWVAWARATRGGPVAVGGVSLGALTAQLTACAAHDWPEEMRPDAMFLIAPSRLLAAVAFEGALTRKLGVPRAVIAAGWTRANFEAWLPLLEPQRPPALPPDRIVVVLGEADNVTLAAGGEALVRHWQVPEENVFRCPAGHFSTSIGLSRDSAPLRRLRAILDRAAAKVYRGPSVKPATPRPVVPMDDAFPDARRAHGL